ncbi:hypothetical protein AB3S75_033748 [Citrus x aurantiifolia]
MGDLMGSPPVALLFLCFQPANPLFSANACTFCVLGLLRSSVRVIRGTSDPPGSWEMAAEGRIARWPSRGRKDNRHGLSRFAVHMLMGATIPALMHRIPSKLRS